MWFWRLTRTTVCSFEAQESLCLCSGLKAGRKPASQFEGHQAEKPSLSAFLFHSGLRLMGEAHPRREGCFAQVATSA